MVTINYDNGYIIA